MDCGSHLGGGERAHRAADGAAPRRLVRPRTGRVLFESETSVSAALYLTAEI